jgi:proteic killer suppression protein
VTFPHRGRPGKKAGTRESVLSPLPWIVVYAARDDDLLSPAGNRLERLKGQSAKRHSIRVNDQYRVTFRWENGHAYEVCVEDYH